MASFAQNSPVQFTPYIPKYNTELYGQVGMLKQAQYNQGVSQAQSYIDSVAGLPIYRDVDKQYLQGKLQEVTTKANQLAREDFSDQKIVSQIGSFAASIYNDSAIQNAISSTQAVKSLMESRKNMKEKHPERYTASAEYHDDQFINSYLSDPEPGKKYVGPREASAHTNYDEPIRKALKEISPTIEYKVDAEGKFTYTWDKNTKVTPAQIQNVVNGIIATNPEFQRSISMDARYTYKDVDAQTLLSSIQDNHSSRIKDLNVLNKTYESIIAKDPNNAKQVDYYKAAIADNLNEINGLQDRTTRYMSHIASGKDISAIKETLFNDNLRNLYSINFQKDIHDKEIKENQEVTKALEYGFKEAEFGLKKDNSWLDFVKAGVDPDTRKAITPGHPLYAVSQRAKKATSGAGASEEVEQLMTTTGSPADVLTVDKIGKEITTLNDQLKGLDSQAETAYLNMYELPRTPENLAKVSSWAAEQKRKIQNGEEPDEAYKAYRQSLQPIETRKQALQELYKSVAEEANRQFPISGTNMAVNYHINGKKSVINIDRESQLVRTLDMVGSKAEEIIKKLEFTNVRPNSELGYNTISSTQRDMATRTAVEELKSQMSPADYAKIKEIADAGHKKFQSVYDATHAVVKGQVKKQNEYIDKTLAEHTVNFNANARNLQVGGEEQKFFDGFAHNLYISKNQEKPNAEGVIAELDVKPSDITANRAYTDLSGVPHIVYSVKGKVYDDILPTDNNIIGRPDPDQHLKNTIEISPYKNSGEMTSSNQKIRYKITKNALNGNYDLMFLDGDHKYNIPVKDPVSGENISVSSPSELIQRVEKISKMKNEVTGQPLSPKEIIERAKASTKSY